LGSKLTPRQKRDALLYNLRPGDRELIAAYQGGRDPVTGQTLKPNANCDHDHKSGLIRGLLNPMTNKLLIDNRQTLINTLKYLENPPAVAALGEKVYGLIGKAQRKKVMKYGPSGASVPHPRRAKV
jgi:hypothetical protein